MTYPINGNRGRGGLSIRQFVLHIKDWLTEALSGMTEALSGKQDTLTFDDAPTAGSTNPVTSGGVKTALDGKLDKSGGTVTGSIVADAGASYFRNAVNIDLSTTSASLREDWAVFLNRNQADVTNSSGRLLRIGASQSANTKNLYVTIGTANPRGGNLPTDSSSAQTSNNWSSIGVLYDYDTNRGYPAGQGLTSWGKTDSNVNHLASTAFVHSVADDYLPLSGGWLTGAVRRNVTGLTKGTAPSSNTWTLDNYSSINEGTDSTARLGGWFHYVDTSMQSITYMQAYGFASGSSTAANVRARVDASNNTYVDLNGSTINANGYLMGTGSVRVNGNFIRKNTAITRGTAPSANQYGYWQFCDNANTALVELRMGYLTNNNHQIALRVSNDSGTWYDAIRCEIGPSDTVPWTYAPTPSQTDDSTKIATTAYVKDCVPKSIGAAKTPVYSNANGVITAGTALSDFAYKAMCTTAAGTSSTASTSKPAVVTANYKSGYNWYRVWSDGFIEQGGRVASSGSGGTSVTLLKAFSDTNYTVTLANNSTNYGDYGGAVSITSKRAMKIYNRNNRAYYWEAKGY